MTLDMDEKKLSMPSIDWRYAEIACGVAAPMFASLAFAIFLPKEWLIEGFLFVTFMGILFGWIMGSDKVYDDTELLVMKQKNSELITALRSGADAYKELKERTEAAKAVPTPRRSEKPKAAQRTAKERLYRRDSKGRYHRIEEEDDAQL